MESHRGFIVLVDISGYTNFISSHNIKSNENEKLSTGQAHAEHIISDLLEKVIDELDGVLIINKLQGDAALFYGVAEGLTTSLAPMTTATSKVSIVGFTSSGSTSRS